MDAPIVHSLYQLYAEFHVILLKFPKSQRYTLGAEVQKELLASLKSVIGAAASSVPSEKSQALRQTSASIDLLKLLIRLCKDCKCINNKQYLELESKLHEIGKMLGGWLKMLQNK